MTKKKASKKKAAPKKKAGKRRRKDVAQTALSIVERAIGGKLPANGDTRR